MNKVSYLIIGAFKMGKKMTKMINGENRTGVMSIKNPLHMLIISIIIIKIMNKWYKNSNFYLIRLARAKTRVKSKPRLLSLFSD